MNRKRPGFGKQLAELHRWNAWLVLALAVSGLLLAWGVIRELGEGRIWIKQLHVAIGVISGILVLLYAPMAKRHLKQLRQRPRQKGNLGFVLFLLVGWLLSGIVLWQLRHFPPRWANVALLTHQLLTYVGLPYILYHSVTRMKWMKQPERRAVRVSDAAESGELAGQGPTVPPGPSVPGPWLTRRQFLKISLGAALAVAVLPSFFRWLGSVPGGSSLVPGGDAVPETDPNRMLPAPQPLPDSANVIGGGAQGRFQVYTVTRLPTFTSDTWRFTIDGLVERPASWSWSEFLQLSRTVQVSDFHCVTGWSVYKNTWEGIPLSRLLREAGVKPSATTVKLYSGDGVYTDSLTLEQANMDDVMVAVLHDGKPIHRDYGGPVRLIVPKMYAYKSVKWLNRIELIDRDHTGYWEERGYDKDAWLKGEGLNG
ncbi:molybdopterin-dependent oxidoreductase [Cohnella sp. CFH 77786]|uniref:molybdopterin-dependent oxidoreductase n=1 Tax=Cohnella sp. CFH 77786 TaxID=2662265 RepID=UPI001C608963|nr:molybdopterin-dependent oxidoreductase [Cohnella sp. CFH 77786]MBW5445970.1 molybdopterin-dependent oxidoreductase [Cohnella sp. CFH 77786]